jgi:protein-disulfide isomerase
MHAGPIVRTTATAISLAAVCGLSLWALGNLERVATARAARVSALEQQAIEQERQLDALRERIERLEEKKRPKKPKVRPGSPDPETVYAVPVAGAHTRGPKDAPVTIVGYMDYQCPFCKRADSTMRALQERYGDDVRFVFKHHPLAFHKQARGAAIAAECAAEQGLFWPAQRVLWDHSRDLSRIGDHFSVALLDLDRQLWQACVDEERSSSAVDSDRVEALRFGARGTPTFFINGRVLSGAQPLERFAERVDEELRAVRLSDVAPADYYEEKVLEVGESSVR